MQQDRVIPTPHRLCSKRNRDRNKERGSQNTLPADNVLRLNAGSDVDGIQARLAGRNVRDACSLVNSGANLACWFRLFVNGMRMDGGTSARLEKWSLANGVSTSPISVFGSLCDDACSIE